MGGRVHYDIDRGGPLPGVSGELFGDERTEFVVGGRSGVAVASSDPGDSSWRAGVVLPHVCCCGIREWSVSL